MRSDLGQLKKVRRLVSALSLLGLAAGCGMPPAATDSADETESSSEASSQTDQPVSSELVNVSEEAVSTAPALPPPRLPAIEMRELLPKLNPSVDSAPSLTMHFPGELSFAVEYPNKGATSDVADLCINILSGGSNIGATCGDLKEIGGLLSFGYFGDDINPPMMLTLVDSTVEVDFDSRCTITQEAKSPTLTLLACGITSDMEETVFTVSSEAGTYELLLPFQLPIK